MSTSNSQKLLLRKFAALTPQPFSWGRLKSGLKGQIEGFYKMNPKHISGDVVPGVSRQSIPQALRSYVRSPIKGLGKSWRAMGPTGGPIVGIGKAPGKILPRAIRSLEAKVPAGYPSMNRLFFAGYTLHKLQDLLAAKDRKGQRLGNLLGASGGWLLGSRLPLLPSIGAWMGAEAIGGGLGKLYDKHISKEGV